MIIKCDKCEQEAEEALEIFEYHFCPKCRDRLNVITIHWVMRMCEFKNERGESRNKSTRKIDWDKACALSIAGWTADAIAYDLHVERSMIVNQLSQRLKMYKHGMRWGAPIEKEEDDDDGWDL